MRGYWCVEGTLGIVLAAAPFVERAGRSARYTDLIFGILFVIWALVGHVLLGDRVFKKAGGAV
jgi:hypothetical protein